MSDITNAGSIAAAIKNILATAERYKHSFFWTPPSSAKGRRAEEFDASYRFTYEGRSYYVRQSLSISCRNMYFSTYVERDGEKTNVTPLKTVLRKIEAATAELRQAA